MVLKIYIERILICLVTFTLVHEIPFCRDVWIGYGLPSGLYKNINYKYTILRIPDVLFLCSNNLNSMYFQQHNIYQPNFSQLLFTLRYHLHIYLHTYLFNYTRNPLLATTLTQPRLTRPMSWKLWTSKYTFKLYIQLMTVFSTNY